MAIKEKLKEKGVIFENIDTVFIGEDINIENIEPNVYLCHGSKIEGNKTYISSGAVIGSQGPVFLKNCCVGKKVDLGSGYFEESVFLDGFKSGGNAHVRPCCIFEEKSSIAHGVGTKQTIIFPYATLGSIINFCDCMLTGGTSSKNHSEVGSSFIHFNFTPNQDKATPSIMGNVYEGVFLKENPVFLGGQGGMVGPCVFNFGNVSAAGSIIRRDELRKNRLVAENMHRNINIDLKSETYSSLNRIVKNNLFYIANIICLKNWYLSVRKNFLNAHIYKFAMELISKALDERLKRLDQLSDKVFNIAEENISSSKLFLLKKNYYENIENLLNEIKKLFSEKDLCLNEKKAFVGGLNFGNSYLEFIHGLDKESVKQGKNWLESICSSVINSCSIILNEFELN